MDIFGVGLPELIFILIIAMMIFGPSRLPEMAGRFGRLVWKLNYMTKDIRAEWDQQFAQAMQIKEKTRREFEKVMPPSPHKIISD